MSEGDGGGRVDRPWEAAVIGAMALFVGAAARSWIRHSAAPLVWNDSADYLASSAEPLFSLDRLAGLRPVLMPLVLSATDQRLERLVLWQTWAAALAWALLAAAVALCLSGVGRRLMAASAVVGLSLTWPISMWDSQVLTESTAITALALLVAAALWCSLAPSAARAAVLVAAAALWLAARDSHLVPLAIVGIGLGGYALRWRPPQRRVVALTGAFLVALAFLLAGAARHGHRDRVPIEHVYAARVLPYPDRVDWFAAHGMADADDMEALPEVYDPTGVMGPYTPVADGPDSARYKRWLATDGRSTLLTYIATHPAYVVREPAARPERVFNNLGGIGGYRPLELRVVPGIGGLLYPPTALTVAVAALAAIVIMVRNVAWRGLGLVGAVLCLTAVPHALAVWHGDGMEAARHLLIPGVQLRMGALLLVLAAALGRATSTAPCPLAR